MADKTSPAVKVKRRKVQPKRRTPVAKVAAAPQSTPALAAASPPRPVEFFKGVLFGPPKSGKTTAAASGTGKKLILLTEPEGDVTLVGQPDISVLRPTTFGEMHQIIRELRAPGHGYDRLVFDSVTFGTELIGGAELYKTLADNRDPRREYGKTGAAMNQLIHDTVGLRMDVAFICQIKTEGDHEDGTPLNPEEGEYPLTMAIQPMVYKILAPAVSFIGRTFKRPLTVEGGGKTLKFGISFEDYGNSPAGSRLGLPDEVFDFAWTDVLTDDAKGGE